MMPVTRADWDKLSLPVQDPAIRSRDWPVTDPFLWFVTRRLGLQTPFRYIEAFNRGDWFHRRAALWNLPREKAFDQLRDDFLIRSTDIKARATDAQFTASGIAFVVEREWEDMVTASAWYEAMGAVVIECQPGQKWSSVPDYFAKDYVTLGTEVQVRVHTDGGIPVVIQIDRLLLHKRSKAIWIADWKTTSKPPSERVKMCPVEFQCWLYTWAFKRLCERHAPVLHKAFPDLPVGYTFGGMIHVPVQKPPIKFCGKDRDKTTTFKLLQSGPRKGQMVAVTDYHGEPKYANYIVRCEDWCLGQGDFVGRAPKATNDPAVGLSFVTPDSLLFYDEWGKKILSYYSDLRTTVDLASYPPGSPQSDNSYRDLYLLNPIHWISLVLEKKLYKGTLDPFELGSDVEIKVLGSPPL